MKQKSGCLSAALLCAGVILAKFLIVVPEYMVKYNGNSAWIEMLLKCCMAFIFLFIILWLYSPFEGKSYDEIAAIAMGKFGKHLINIVYAAALILFNAGLLRMLIEALRTIGMNTARYEYFAIFILAAVLCGAYMGINAVTNISTVVFPLIIISLVTILVMMIPHYRMENIMPIFGKGADKIGISLLTQHYGFFEYTLLLFIAPRIGNRKQMQKTGTIAILIVSSCAVLLTLAYCLVVPFPASETFFLPFYQLSRTIKAGTFLQRMEPFIVFVWTALILCSMSAMLALVSRLLNGGKDTGRHAFVPLTVLITYFISMLPQSELTAFNAYEQLLRYGFILFPVIPVVVFLIARMRKAGKKTC